MLKNKKVIVIYQHGYCFRTKRVEQRGYENDVNNCNIFEEQTINITYRTIIIPSIKKNRKL